MSNFDYEFRVLIETEKGAEISYGTSSLISLPPNTSKVVTTEQMVDKINAMPSMSYYNAPAFTTSSALYEPAPEVVVSHFRGNPVFGNRTFEKTTLPSNGLPFDGATSYQYVSMSIKDNTESGSILFHSNTIPCPSPSNDFLKKYKFWGNKVCQVLGIPENYWIYADKFRLSNTGSEENYLSGDVLATSLHLKTNFAINNAGSITSDLPFRHFQEADRYVRWTDISSSIPVNRMLIGYNQHRDEYGIEMPSEDILMLSSSVVSASGDIVAAGSVIANGVSIVEDDGNIEPAVLANQTGSYLTDISYGAGQGVIQKTSPVGGSSPTSLGAITNLGNTGNPTFATITTTGQISSSDNILAESMSIGGANFEKHLTVGGDISGSGNLFIGNQTTGGSLYVNGGQNDSSDNRFRFHHNLQNGFIDIRNTSTRAGDINIRGLTGDVNYHTAMTINADHDNAQTLTVEGDISASGALTLGTSIDESNDVEAGTSGGSQGPSAFQKHAGVQWKIFTGHTSNVNGEVKIPHNITNGEKRIVSVSVNVRCGVDGPGQVGTDAFISSGNFQDGITAGREFQAWYDNSHIYLHTDAGSDDVDNKRYTMIVMYANKDLF
tara:strand:- start:732 stop:2552 length:1821 start_codon:yes stop_codon:yes gene_type:complete